MHTRHWIMLGLSLAVLWPTAAAAGPAEDKAMANQIANEIRDSGRLTNFRVGVKYQDGVATLLGNVTDKSQAAAAMKVAKQQAGVERVVSKLELTNPKPAPSTVAKNALHTESAKSDQGEDVSELLAMPASIADSKVTQASIKMRAQKALKLKRSAREPKLEQVASKPKRMNRKPQTAMMPAPQSQQMRQVGHSNNMPRPVAWSQQGRPPVQAVGYGGAGPRPAGYHPGGGGATGVGYDNPNMPGYAWPSYAAPQNYSALTYPKQYSPTAWPYIGPFYPYPQVPLGWRKVALEWDDGWWFLDFSHHQSH